MHCEVGFNLCNWGLLEIACVDLNRSLQDSKISILVFVVEYIFNNCFWGQRVLVFWLLCIVWSYGVDNYRKFYFEGMNY